MSIRNILATYNLVGVSANIYEPAINAARGCDLGLLVKKEDIIQIDRRLQTNADEAIGKEEPDCVYDLGGIAQGIYNFDKAQPQHFGFICGFALGNVSVATAGLGYKHTIAPIKFDLDAARSCPSFTLIQRLGNQVLKEQFPSMFIDSFTASFPKDDWAKLQATLKGTGRRLDNITLDSLVALDNATTLTLAANGVHGSDAAERLSNVHQIIAEYPSGTWVDVAFSAVSSATPAVITIASVGGTGGSISYKVIYIPVESGWAAAFPSRVNETPLRTSQLSVNIGGKWNGTVISGGHSLAAEIKTLEWKFANNLTPEFAPGSGNLSYANRCLRSGRTQTISLGREFRDYIYQQHIDANDTFVVYAKAEGSEYSAGHRYTVEIVFPKVAVLKASKGVDGNRLSEALELQVLEDDTYGSVIVYVKNLQPKYCQAA